MRMNTSHRRQWDIFCRVIDNYGDIGVSWRLARQLVAEVRRVLQTASDAVKPDLDIALSRMRQTLPASVIPYHVAVAAYNEALDMRPAAWLAKRLKFQPALRMDLSVASS